MSTTIESTQPVSTKNIDWFGSIAALIGRLLFGVVLAAHGWQKLTEWGPSGTAAAFESMGVPLPAVSAQIATWAELGGGVLILLGLFVRFVGPLIAFVMAGAVYFAGPTGILASNGGWELEAVIAAAALFIAAAGAGALSLDRVLANVRAGRATF
ncbi:DoxX family protein [Corynebacterium meitnerae]|uniref:DoxX family protein n=1 Tax=Corynebacterium meitnerae TaxID=2913498 RepID=A0A9X3LY56_9CORY|nr:DoxX family protein [Corynebacterium meitnerae]MCZ9294898.1 DoxX family protein [Corynebacterium meitnerae]